MAEITKDELAKALYYLADCVRFTESTIKQHCCNGCSAMKSCEYKPDWGEPTRINCPLWKPMQNERVINHERCD